MSNKFKIFGLFFLLTELANINYVLFLFGVSEKNLPIYYLTGWGFLPLWFQAIPLLHFVLLIPVFIMYLNNVHNFGVSNFTKLVKWVMIFDVVFFPVFILMNMAG